VTQHEQGALAGAQQQRAGFAAVLEIRGAGRMVASAVIGRMPLGMLTLGALLLVQQEYGSFALAGLAVGALALGSGVAAPVQGALMDRHGARRVLIPVAAGQAAVTWGFAVSAAVSAPSAVVVLLALGVGMLTPPVSAALRTTWMNVAEQGPVRDAAFALDAMTTQLLFALGPLLTAVAIELVGTVTAVILAGLISLVGTFVFAGAIPLRVASELRSRARSLAAERGERFSRIAALRSRGLRLVLVTVVLIGWAGGCMEVALSGLAVHLGSASAAGVLIGLWCLGGVSGGWFYGRRRWRAPIERRHQAAAFGAALASLPLLAAGTMPLALAFSFTAGLPWAPLFACQYQMVADQAPEHALSEAFTWNTSGIIGGGAIGSALAGVTIAELGVYACFVQTAVLALSSIGWDFVTTRPATALRRAR
jgi:MFS family permease